MYLRLRSGRIFLGVIWMQKHTSKPRSAALLVYMALFTALNIIFTRVLAFDLGPYRIAFGPVSTIMAGLWLGPLCGGLCGFMSDVLGYFILGYPPNPLILVTAVLWGVFPGLGRKMLPGLDRKRRTGVITVSIALAGLIGSIGFTTAGLVLLLGYNFYAIFPGRVVQTVIMTVMYSTICCVLYFSPITSQFFSGPPLFERDESPS